MNYLLSLLAGLIVALMVVQNGALGEAYGISVATVLIHIVGFIGIALVLLIRRINPFAGGRLRWYLYLGGVIGVCTTAFTNIAFSVLSVSAILALSLLGQSIISLVFDSFGVLGLAKQAFKPWKLLGMGLGLAGIVLMVFQDSVGFAVAIPVLLGLGAGVTVVLSRTVNAALSAKLDVLTSSMFNYITGLATALIVLGISILADKTLPVLPANFGSFWMYLGGLSGVLAVLLCNILVSKVSSFYLTLLMFIGQVFTGLALDRLLTGIFQPELLIGGLLVAAGLAQNLFLDRETHSTL